MTREKYDELAERFTDHEYGDPARYFGHRAEIVVSLGPPLEPGDAILDLACADGSAVPPLVDRGLRYLGVDASDAMLEVARRQHGARARFELGDLLTYEPSEPVAATTIFRSLHFVDDRVAFFRRVAGFTEKKLVFDVAACKPRVLRIPSGPPPFQVDVQVKPTYNLSKYGFPSDDRDVGAVVGYSFVPAR